MTPSNPDNQQPLIYRIADALGVFHIVAPVNHTHAQSEVEGLVAALAAKANASDVTSALNGKADANHTHHDIGRGAAGGITVDEDGEISVGCTSIVITMQGVQGDIEVLPENAANLKRALLNPDSTPTTNSDKLVTSGGVNAALESKANKVDVMYSVFEKSDENENIELDNVFSDGHETSHFVLINRMGELIKVSDFFYTQYGELVENGQTLSNYSTAIVKIIHYNDGSTIRFYMVVEEVFEA